MFPITDVDIAGSSISVAPVIRVVPGLISAPEERQQEVMNFCPKTLFESARYWHLLQCWVLDVWSEFLQEIKSKPEKMSAECVTRLFVWSSLFHLFYFRSALENTKYFGLHMESSSQNFIKVKLNSLFREYTKWNPTPRKKENYLLLYPWEKWNAIKKMHSG